MWKDFKAFIARGNVVDLAIAVMIGAAVGRVITSLVNDIIMPPIGLMIGGLDFANLFITLRGGPYASLAAAKAAGAPTINYGVFINNFVDFLLIAATLFRAEPHYEAVPVLPLHDPARGHAVSPVHVGSGRPVWRGRRRRVVHHGHQPDRQGGPASGLSVATRSLSCDTREHPEGEPDRGRAEHAGERGR